jgi:hypothetical protein
MHLSRIGKRPFLLLTLLILLLAACGGGGEEGAAAVADDFVRYESEDGRFSVRHPESWAIDDSFFITLASDPALLEDSGLEQVDDGALILFIFGATEEFGGEDPVAILNQLTTERMGLVEGADVTQEPETTEIQGQPAAHTIMQDTAEDGTALQVQMTAVTQDNDAVVALTALPQASVATYQPTVDAILNTIEIMPAAE